MRRIQISKRLFFEYFIKGEFKEFNVTVPLYNKYFSELDRIDLKGDMIEDKFGNVSIKFDMKTPKRTFIKYFCDVQTKKLPDSVFVPAKEIVDVFEAPEHLKIDNISQKALKSVKEIGELKSYLRDNFKFEKCEYAAKSVALFAEKKGIKVAAASGFLDNHKDAKEIASIKDHNKKFNFQNHLKHYWALLKTPKGIEVCDPKVFAEDEHRFVDQLNTNNPMTVNWEIEGEKETAEINSHIYTVVIWR